MAEFESAARTVTVLAIDATSAVVRRSAALVFLNMVDLLFSISTISKFANLFAAQMTTPWRLT